MLSCRQRGNHVLKTSALSRRVAGRSYSNKVRVFPFVASKEKAVAWLNCGAALTTGDRPLNTLLRYVFPSLDLDALRPVRVQPAYIPTWVVDAELEGTIWAKKQDTDDHFTKDTAQIQFAQTELPGFTYRPLSSLSFMTPELLEANTVPWSDDLRKNGEDQVLCPPFAHTPFHLSEAMRTLSTADATVADVLRFEPSSVKETMMAAYPVLIPVYLAQYKVMTPIKGQRQEMTITAYLEAGVPNGRIAGETVPVLKEMLGMWGIDPPELLVGGRYKDLVHNFTNVRSLTAHNVTLAHRTLVEEYADRALVAGKPLRRYRERFFPPARGAAAIDWTDTRIRPFEPEERHTNLRWLAASADLFLLRSMLQVYERRRETGGRACRAGQRDRVGEDADCRGGEGQRGAQAGVVVCVRAPGAPA
ncbi:uncharacterized protein TRAVEDRAFT_29627 [Trametes versicolor FP-101664 SS1]|uniref:uncharacterized protein n=1 Tax=Trametes versicolor (strain FP-101664) TaxID=717944 RepID=UPI00046243FA|nr:uncharacterized protein TRAVEDRAFT_29627 [Trametes versicolor FP-101664 SS1]EIW57579.1 hypothetical protein TRAVEDRAFT_29627 [Trametes versicolor FP-101664 SS1]